MGAKGPRDQKRLADLTTVLDSYSIKIQPELKTVIAAAQGYDNYTAGRLWIHHIFFASILDPIIAGRPIAEQAKIIAQVEKQLEGTKLYNNIENLIPLVKELHLNDILSSHSLATAGTDITGKSMQDVTKVLKSGDLSGKGKVFGFNRPAVITTGKGGGTTYLKSWDMKAKHGFSLEQIANFRNMPADEVAKAATDYVRLSQDYFRQVNLVSAALSPDQVSRNWAQYLVNNTPDGEKILNRGLKELFENNNQVLQQFEKIPEKLLANQRAILSRANAISNRFNQYAAEGPIKYIDPILKGTSEYPEGLQHVDEVMDIYKQRALGQLKPGQVNQKLRELLANRDLSATKIERSLFPSDTAKASAYSSSKELLSGTQLGEEYIGKNANKVLQYSPEAGKLFKKARFLKPWMLAIPVVAPIVSGIGTGVQAAETIRNPTAENKARLMVNLAETGGEVVSTAGWLTLNPALVAGGEAVATPAGLADLGWTGKDLGLHKWQTWRRLGAGVKDWAVDRATDDKGISSLWHNDNKSREETAEVPTQSTGVLNQREGTEDTEEELKVGVSNFN